jgi:hypothetical protein
MVFNATFNNISVISWQSVLLVEETGVPGENQGPVASHWQTLSHNVVSNTYRLSGFELATFVVIGTDCIGSHKSNYHTITKKFSEISIFPYISYKTFFKEYPQVNSRSIMIMLICISYKTAISFKGIGPLGRNRMVVRFMTTYAICGGELRCSGRVSSSCSTSGTSPVNLVAWVHPWVLVGFVLLDL